MRKVFVTALVGAGIILGWVAQAAATRIMPLGDSITESADGHASYRYWLWHDLLDADYVVDFVGSRYGVHGGLPLYPDFDQDHEGHWGWRADQILAQIGGWAAAHQPDVILLHLGHNDLWQGQGVASTIADLEAIVGVIRESRPAAVFLLAQVIPAVPGIGLDEIPLLNAEIPGLAERLHTQESPVMVVDQFTGFDPYVDTWDGVHPDESGELKMSARWFAALQTALPEPLEVPEERGAAQLDTALLAGPNPFVGRTVLSWRLARASDIALDLYDATGRRLARLAAGIYSAGTHSLSWNGGAVAGRPLPPGVYQVRMTSGEETRVLKLVSIR